MGNWYTNIAIKGAAQPDVLAALNELGRRSYVTPENHGWVVIYDQECDKFDLDELESLALTISTRLSCTALASFNADDDVLWIGAFEAGTRTARYASAREQFEDSAEFPALLEVAEVLCRMFGKSGQVMNVQKILRRGHGALGLLTLLLPKLRVAYIAEVVRHADLAKSLGIPLATVGLGYRYVNRGKTPPGMNRDALQRTLAG